MTNRAWRGLFAGLGFALLVVAIFGALLLPGTPFVVSHPMGDVARYFLPARAFGYSELAEGNLPFWNPYLFSGTPFVGAWQSAMFYPPNLLHLALPLPLGLNVEAALDVFLMASFTCFWARQRGLRSAGAFFAGVVAVCSGAYVERLLAGQLSVLAVLAWAPLFFCAVEKIIDKPTPGWVLVAILALAMQLLAGYPGYVLMTGLVAAGLVVARLGERGWRGRARSDAGSDVAGGGGQAGSGGSLAASLGALLAIGVGAAALAAVQLLTGLATAQESLRAGGVEYDWAATYSLPPENLLTLFVPAILGDVLTVPYWGRTFFWDANLFFGVVTLALAALGATAPGRARARRGVIVLIFATLVLALGRHTPLHRLLFEWLPGFAQLRAPSKFSSFTVFGVALLAGLGVDRLLGAGGGTRRVALGLGLFSLMLFLGAALVGSLVAAGDWSALVRRVQESREVAFWLSDADIARAGILARQGFLLAGAVALLAGLLFWLATRWRAAAWGIVLLALLELVVFARTYRGAFAVSELDRPVADRWFREVDPALRTLDLGGQLDRGRNRALLHHRQAIWGYDPVVLGRYGEFMLRAMGLELPSWSMTHLVPLQFHSLMRLLRIDAVLRPGSDAGPVLPPGKQGFRMWGERQNGGVETPDSVELIDAEPLPRFFFVSEFRVLADRQEVLAALGDPGFDPARVALLDRKPGHVVEHQGSVHGQVELIRESTDELDFEAVVDADALLVVTDSFSEGWRAVALDPEDSRVYEVLPVDHTLLGIPLVAGTHRIRLEYAPAAARIGGWISAVSAFLYLTAVAAWAIRCRRFRRSESGVGPLSGRTVEKYQAGLRA